VEFPNKKSCELRSHGLNETGKLGLNHRRKERKKNARKVIVKKEL
jgi:hypothetical protein